MYEKFCTSLIFSKLEVAKLLIYIHRMHNLYAIFAKFLNICKQVGGNSGFCQSEKKNRNPILAIV